MKHVMVDIETLGTKPGSVILSIGACRFDESGVGETFYRAIDVFDSLMAGLAVDQATVGWWRLQSAEVRGALQPAVMLGQALAQFASFYVSRPADQPARFLWAKGPDFDCVLLDAAYMAFGGKAPWKYNATRDVRTILALAPGVVSLVAEQHRAELPHHALSDAVFQAKCVIQAAEDLGFPLSEMA